MKVGNEGIVTESRDFIKRQAFKNHNSQVYLHSDIIQIPDFHNADQNEKLETPARLKQFLSFLGTHFNQKNRALVPLNWEEYSEYIFLQFYETLISFHFSIQPKKTRRMFSEKKSLSKE